MIIKVIIIKLNNNNNNLIFYFNFNFEIINNFIILSISIIIIYQSHPIN